MISLAQLKDLDEVDKLAVLVITDMMKSSIPQWTLDYPRNKHYFKDVLNDSLYIYKEGNIILGAISILPENDPPYKTITRWLKSKSLVLHRILVHPNKREKGIAQKLLDYAITLGENREYESLKIDTHRENYKMKKFLEKNNFQDIGYLEIIDREAYEKVLVRK